MKKTILFDMDGTLIDAYDFIFEAVKHTLIIHKHPFPSQEIIQNVLTALKRLKVDPKNAYMVGDTKDDILAGKSAGVKTIGVTYGFAGKSIKDHNPDFVIDDLEEIINVLKYS